MIYILPGMGATSKMYAGPWHEIEDCFFIDWPPYRLEKSITDLANKLIAQFQINQNDIIIGSSLGGMVGLEIANIIGVQRVILVGSALNSKEISFFSRVVKPLAVKPIVQLSQLISSWSNDLIQQMYSRAEPDFIVYMSKAILNWRGFSGSPSEVVRIHGKKDLFITCPVSCKIIGNGGHFIAISHARECVDFIKKHI